MAEIGLILSIASLVQLSNLVLTSCVDYVDKVKNAPADIHKIINEVSGLEFILKRLSNLVPSDENDARLASLKALYELPTGPFNACSEVLGEMAKKLEKISGSGVLRRRLMWPFEGGKVEELLAGLEKHKSTFMLALAGDSAEMDVVTSEAISKIGSQIDDLQIREERRLIAEWLRGADPSTNHNAARKKHEPGTGDWLLNLKDFETWKDGEGGVLWLYGIPGAGKTVLSSTVVEHLRGREEVGGRPRGRIAYYYFDFNDHGKQTAQGCIQSLVRQLFEQSDQVPEELRSLYNDNRHGTPSLEKLIDVLIAMLSDDPPDFIIIDALDECKEDEGERERQAFYEALQEIKSNAEGRYKFFIASRPEPDIKRELSELGVTEVNVEKTLVDEDIRSHVRALLPKEARFKKWPGAVKKEIEDTLVKQSNGMFRWAACQLDALRTCVKPANALKQLHNLPKTLEGTYTRILQRVPSDNEREMRTILMVLAFSARPMTIQEVAEATAVDLESQTFSKDERFGDAYDILELCSSLVSLAEFGSDSILRKEKKYVYNWDKDIKIVQFAHFSVKEYILSDMARKSMPETLYINESLSQSYITAMCLIYLLDFNGGERATDIDHNEFAFLGYAVLHWTTHLTLVPENDRDDISKLLIRLFDSNHPESLMNYLNLYNPISSWNIMGSQNGARTINFGTQYRNKHDFETPLYYACYYGLSPVVDALLGKKAGSHTRNAQELGSALEAAASGGHDEIIKRLLAEGADPNAKYCTQFFRPIQAAAHSGRPSTVNLLLAAGADISPASYGRDHGTALHVAAREGSPECILALLNAGHELNHLVIGTEHRGTALAVAAANGHDAAIACLVRNGADPNICSYWYNYPLTLACEKCSLDSVRAILDAGADVNGAGGHTSLHEAAVRGDIDIMRLLIERGADVNAAGSTYGTPLKGAIQSRDMAVFRFMLDCGADVNACGSKSTYPIDQAIFGGNIEAADMLLEMGAKFSDEALAEALSHESKEYLVKELLKRGADPNAEHERQGNMLQLAIYKSCQEKTIRWLLEAGADVNAVEGEYGTALQAAVIRKKDSIVRLLLEYGAEVNLPACGEYGNPLQAAISYKLEPITQLLLEKGADIHALGGTYRSILQAAAESGNEAVATLSLSKGVEVNTVGGKYGTALRAAIAMEHQSIVKLLLDAGAQINIKATATHGTKANEWRSNEFESTLEVATASCNTSIFQLLLDHGMVLSPEYIDNALVQAVTAITLENRLKMIDFLISKGADIKKHGGKALFFACEFSGKIEVIRKLLSLDAPVNWYYEKGHNGSALMNAIDRGHKEITQALLDAGADVNLAAGDSGTALIQAISKGNKELAMELLDRGADPNIKAGKWGTALTIAVKNGDEDMFYGLLKRGADVNLTHGYHGTALQAAISYQYYHLAQEFLDRGADPAAPGVHGTPLICASGYGKAGQLELIQRLLTLGVPLEPFDIERPEDRGDYMGTRWLFNALQNAARAGNEAVATMLLDAGANINAVGGTYGTALQAAVKENHEGIVKLLLQRGADINLTGGEYGTPLQAAAAHGRAILVSFLLNNGADSGINIEAGKYGTALQAACTTSNTQIVTELLARGAAVNTHCGQFGNPLSAAAHHGFVEHVETLLAHGADVNCEGGEYGFALQAAVASERNKVENVKVVRLLLEKGADVNKRGGEFGTALQAAAGRGHRRFVEVLLEYGAERGIEGGKWGSALEAAREKGDRRILKLLTS